jgi:hypothetical protein
MDNLLRIALESELAYTYWYLQGEVKPHYIGANGHDDAPGQDSIHFIVSLLALAIQIPLPLKISLCITDSCLSSLKDIFASQEHEHNLMNPAILPLGKPTKGLLPVSQT